jgi:hypothetical protein
MKQDASILRIRTKEGRILRITLPREIYGSVGRGISPRFLRNLTTIASIRSNRSIAKADGRATHRYRRLYRRGFPLNKLLALAAKTLNERDFEAVTRSCVREMNDKKKAEIDWPDIDVVICFLDAVGALTDCSASEASKRISSYLRDHGVGYQLALGLAAEAYRKRRQRLRRDGVKLGPDKSP